MKLEEEAGKKGGKMGRNLRNIARQSNGRRREIEVAR